jgi:dephospho-CoA kinase
MIVIGLTGGSGAGKGEVCKAFLYYGVEAIDTDKVSREVAGKGKPCLDELVHHFSGAILTGSGELNRAALAEAAFASEEKLLLLNKITHKYILDECRQWIADRLKANRQAVIVDAPLLFESGFDKSCDCVIAVTADAETRIARITERDGIPRETALKRIEKQQSDEFYASKSNFVIDNNTGRDIPAQVRDICSAIGIKREM